MNNFETGNLLTAVRQSLGLKFEPSAASSFQACYSATARNALASLWNTDEENEDGPGITVEGFRCRIRELFTAYEKLCGGFGLTEEQREFILSGLYDTLEFTGQFYWRPRRLAPAVRKEASCEGISFLRGFLPNENVRMSGAGTYIPAAGRAPGSLDAVASMFRISLEPLADRLTALAQGLSWRPGLPTGAEFLSNGNWKPGASETRMTERLEPPSAGFLRLARIGLPGERQFFLCRQAEDKGFEQAQVPAFLTRPGKRPNAYEKHKSAFLSDAVLKTSGQLPPIRVTRTDFYAEIYCRQFLPADLEAFFELFSWPSLGSSPIHHRVMSLEVYPVFKAMAERIGFAVKES